MKSIMREMPEIDAARLASWLDQKIAHCPDRGRGPEGFRQGSGFEDVRLDVKRMGQKEKALVAQGLSERAGDRGRTGDVQLGKLAFYR